MGGDGQALTNKRTLLNSAKEYTTSGNEVDREKQSFIEEQANKWKHCPISLEPLEAPVVFDLGGVVYSKISVLDLLVEKKATEECSDGAPQPSTFDIKKISDVREVANQSDGGHITCPITGYVTISGAHSFIGFWGCGHVVAASTVSSCVPDEEECLQDDCPVCGVRSVKVRLMLPLKDEKTQRKKLRLLVRSTRKRQRDM